MNQKHGYSDFIPAFQEDNRENTLKACRQYMQSHIPEKTPYVRLFSQQLRYISPLFWIWQIIVFLGVMILAVAVPKGEMFAGELLYYTGPLVGILAYPEMFRDLFYDMSEIENSCKNNSATLFVMRLLIVGVMNLLLLTLLAVVTSTAWDSYWQDWIFITAPFQWSQGKAMLVGMGTSLLGVIYFASAVMMVSSLCKTPAASMLLSFGLLMAPAVCEQYDSFKGTAYFPASLMRGEYIWMSYRPVFLGGIVIDEQMLILTAGVGLSAVCMLVTIRNFERHQVSN